MKDCANIDRRVFGERVKSSREKEGCFQWLVEEEEARKRHSGPYQYQTPGEIAFCMGWWKVGVSGRR